jgi:hypothetical protein
MEKKAPLIQRLDEARAQMRALLAEVDPRAEIYPGWTMKEILAHIAGWDDAVAASLRAHAGGQEPGTPALEGIDAYNIQSVATRQALAYDQVVREWELAREQLKAAIDAMPAEKFDERLLVPWGGRGTIPRLVHIFAEHEEEHAAEVREIITRTKPA